MGAADCGGRMRKEMKRRQKHRAEKTKATFCGLFCVIKGIAAVLVIVLLGGRLSLEASAARTLQPSETESAETSSLFLTEEERQLLEALKDRIAAGELETEEQIREAVTQAEEELGLTLTEEQRERVVSLAEKISALAPDPDEVLAAAQELYEKYGSELKESADEAIQEKIVEPAKEAAVEGVKSALKDFFSELVNSVKEFFSQIFSK